MTFAETLEALQALIGRFVLVNTSLEPDGRMQLLTQSFGTLKSGNTVDIPGTAPEVAHVVAGGDAVVFTIADENGITRFLLWVSEEGFTSGELLDDPRRVGVIWGQGSVRVAVVEPSRPAPLPGADL